MVVRGQRKSGGGGAGWTAVGRHYQHCLRLCLCLCLLCFFFLLAIGGAAHWHRHQREKSSSSFSSLCSLSSIHRPSSKSSSYCSESSAVGSARGGTCERTLRNVRGRSHGLHSRDVSAAEAEAITVDFYGQRIISFFFFRFGFCFFVRTFLFDIFFFFRILVLFFDGWDSGPITVAAVY